MSDIYALHQSAFSSVSAYVVLKDGERVATVALKYPATALAASTPMSTGSVLLWFAHGPAVAAMTSVLRR